MHSSKSWRKNAAQNIVRAGWSAYSCEGGEEGVIVSMTMRFQSRRHLSIIKNHHLSRFFSSSSFFAHQTCLFPSPSSKDRRQNRRFPPASFSYSLLLDAFFLHVCDFVRKKNVRSCTKTQHNNSTLKKKKHHDAKSFEPSVETFASVGFFFGDVRFVPNTVTFSEHLQSLRRGRRGLFGQRPRQRSHRRRREKFQQSGPVESHESVALWKRFRFGFLRYG